MNSEIDLGIEVGATFLNLTQFEELFNTACKSKCVQYYKKDTRTIDSARRRKIVRHLNNDLKFYSIRWSCIHGGRQFKSRSASDTMKRKTLRKEILCPAFVHLIISDSGNEFVVSGVNNTHNHIVSEQLFKHLPHNRRMPDDVKADVKKLLHMKTNKHMLRDDLVKRLNTDITLKDLRNLQHRGKVDSSNRNNITKVVEKIQSLFGAECHLLTDEDDVFKGLFFSSKEMIDSLAAYPEIVFMDATYKLLAIKAPVYIILNIDGNGESNIIAVGILMSEDKESLSWFLETFKKIHSAATNIINIMTDKDITEREVLRTSLPGSTLHICVFHVLQIFRRTITCEKFKFSSTTKEIILKLLQNLVYSKSEQEFSEILEQIKIQNDMVSNYLNKNWVNIKEEWCPFIGFKNKNFMSTTNNRLEGVNAKLKSVIDKHSSLEDFIESLAVIYSSLEREKNGRTADSLLKRKIRNNHEKYFQHKYCQLLTPYAFNKLTSQFDFKSVHFTVDKNKQFLITKSKGNQLNTSENTCSCYFFNSMGMPCKHIFAIRKHLKTNLFDSGLVLNRWTKSYFESNCKFLEKEELVETPVINNISNIDILNNNGPLKNRPLSSQQKYRKTFVKAKLLASLASDACGVDYSNINKTLDILIDNLQNGKFDIFKHFTEDLENTISTEEIREHPISTVEGRGHTILTDHNYCCTRQKNESREISKVKVPVCKRRGRPSGSDITVIGLAKKRKKGTRRFFNGLDVSL